MRTNLLVAPGIGAVLAAVACSGAASSPDTTTSAADAGATSASSTTLDFVATADDFACLSTWTRVRNMRITNLVSEEARTQAIAIATKNQSGADYPVGTVVQIIPTHAMVKRRAGFNSTGGDWEFFALDVSDAGTTIEQRGGSEVTAPGIGSCQRCHARAKRFDYLCETNHGCASNGHTLAELLAMQDDDPRCDVQR